MCPSLEQDLQREWLLSVPAEQAVSISVEVRSGGAHIGSRAPRRSYYAASTVKLALGCALLDEAERTPELMTRRVLIRDDFPSAAGRRFTIRRDDDQDDATWDRLGRTTSLGALLGPMLARSSNIAGNLVMDTFGTGPLRSFLHRLGLTPSMSVNRLIGDEAAERCGLTNTVNAHALAVLMDRLASGRLLGPAATQTALRLLNSQEHRRMIPAGLPPGTWSASKGGWVTGIKHDVAHVRPTQLPAYTVAICSCSSLDEAGGYELVARLSASTWKVWTRWHEL